MVDALDLHDGFVGWRLKHSIVTASTGVSCIDGAAQCLSPETCGLIDIIGIAVNEQRAKAGVMHD
jgi:hypothetical protein